MFLSNFEAIDFVTLVLEPKNRPASLAYKSGLTQKRPKYDINYFTQLYVLKAVNHPANSSGLQQLKLNYNF